jgi:hypothetical protein
MPSSKPCEVSNLSFREPSKLQSCLYWAENNHRGVFWIADPRIIFKFVRCCEYGKQERTKARSQKAA